MHFLLFLSLCSVCFWYGVLGFVGPYIEQNLPLPFYACFWPVVVILAYCNVWGMYTKIKAHVQKQQTTE